MTIVDNCRTAVETIAKRELVDVDWIDGISTKLIGTRHVVVSLHTGDNLLGFNDLDHARLVVVEQCAAIVPSIAVSVVQTATRPPFLSFSERFGLGHRDLFEIHLDPPDSEPMARRQVWAQCPSCGSSFKHDPQAYADDEWIECEACGWAGYQHQATIRNTKPDSEPTTSKVPRAPECHGKAMTYDPIPGVAGEFKCTECKRTIDRQQWRREQGIKAARQLRDAIDTVNDQRARELLKTPMTWQHTNKPVPEPTTSKQAPMFHGGAQPMCHGKTMVYSETAHAYRCSACGHIIEFEAWQDRVTRRA